MVFQGCFKEVSKKFLGRFKSFSTKFQGCIKEDYRVFQGNFQWVARIFEKISHPSTLILYVREKFCFCTLYLKISLLS